VARQNKNMCTFRSNNLYRKFAVKSVASYIDIVSIKSAHLFKKLTLLVTLKVTETGNGLYHVTHCLSQSQQSQTLMAVDYIRQSHR